MSKYLSILQRYKTLDISTQELITQLSDVLIFYNEGSKSSINIIRQIEGVATISSHDVIKVLNKFLEGEVDEKDLQEWATFIRLYDDAYDFDIKESEKQRQVLTDVLFKLSAPDINADIDKTMVKYYLNCILSQETPEL